MSKATEELTRRLTDGPVVLLDGAMGTELQRRGVPMHPVAWSAAALKTHPQVVRQIHADNIAAGAEIITTNSFGTSRHVLEPAGLGGEVAALNRLAVTLAREARDASAADRPIWIAGSISSFIAEADLKNTPSLKDARRSYSEQAELLAEAGVDFLLLEMMRDIDYSRLAVECAMATGLPVWIGFTCKKNGEAIVLRGRDVERPLAEAIGPVTEAGGALVAIMHSELDVVEPALDILCEQWAGAMGAYPHSGDFVMPNWLFDDVVDTEPFAETAAQWVDRVAVLGGCCGISPDHIRALALKLGRA
jgi:S-methylmethionine-dependent homocysteine/selenocysteine methylase